MRQATTILYRPTCLRSINLNMYSTQGIPNANHDSSRLLGAFAQAAMAQDWDMLKLILYKDNMTSPSMLCQMLLILGALYSGRVAALVLAWAEAGPNHTPSATLLCHSVLVSWQSAHAGHQNHRQKSPRVLPDMPNFSRICFLR